jgi:hypothetical protein
MSAFETWQVIMGIVQSAILLGTLLAAIYIGLKQAEISKRQADISEVQTNISKSLADLPFVVSVEVAYDATQRCVNIANKGQTNIYLLGTKLGESRRVLEKEPRLITPGGFYYLLAETLEGQLRAAQGPSPDIKGVLEIYLTSQNDVKYVVRTIIIGERRNDTVAIHTQTTSIRPDEWQPPNLSLQRQ